jgi:Ca2+-binding RTX toxin-like protein
MYLSAMRLDYNGGCRMDRVRSPRIESVQLISIVGNGGDDLLTVAEVDTLTGWNLTGPTTIRGGDGNDHLVGCDDFSDCLFGDAGNDSIQGYGSADYIEGGSGLDTVVAGEGNDTVFGNDGNDSLLGEGGNDSIFGGDDQDTLFGGTGNDSMLGGDSADWIHGNAGDDTLHGGSGQDSIEGNTGADSIAGGLDLSGETGDHLWHDDGARGGNPDGSSDSLWGGEFGGNESAVYTASAEEFPTDPDHWNGNPVG